MIIIINKNKLILKKFVTFKLSKTVSVEKVNMCLGCSLSHMKYNYVDDGNVGHSRHHNNAKDVNYIGIYIERKIVYDMRKMSWCIIRNRDVVIFCKLMHAKAKVADLISFNDDLYIYL